MEKEPKMIVVHRSVHVGKDGKKWRVVSRAPLLSPKENFLRQTAFIKGIHKILSEQRNLAPVK